jgi:hypothetical protein
LIVGVALQHRQGAAQPPALAELVLVTEAGELRYVAARVAVEAGLDEPDAALVFMECVVEAEPEVDFVVQSAAVRGLPVGVVRKAVDLEIESALVGGRGGRHAQGERREELQHPTHARLHLRSRS